MSKKRKKRKLRGMWRVKTEPPQFVDGPSVQCDGPDCQICRMLDKAKVDSTTV